MTDRQPRTRADYPRHVAMGTRWGDNDVYGHVSNVVYYAFFDTAVNGILVEAGALDIADAPVIGLVVETGCRYHAPTGAAAGSVADGTGGADGGGLRRPHP